MALCCGVSHEQSFGCELYTSSIHYYTSSKLFRRVINSLTERRNYKSISLINEWMGDDCTQLHTHPRIKAHYNFLDFFFIKPVMKHEFLDKWSDFYLFLYLRLFQQLCAQLAFICMSKTIWVQIFPSNGIRSLYLALPRTQMNRNMCHN